MKIKETKFNDKVMGAEKEMTFSISDDNPIIFEILRNKMYSNKVGSICREVASNSRDANRESGCAGTPITIEIIQPDKLLYVGDLSISFEDNGIGITPDRMENVFVKYAASTKRDSDGQTGGFGLGAKTPFAYTDTFTIATVCDWDGKRLEFIYTAMIDSTRKGKMVLFETNEVDKPTGTKIIIPIANDEDREKFEYESMYYTSMWKEGVNYIGFDLEETEVEMIIEQDSFDVVNMTDGKRYQLLIDGVPYPLDSDAVGITDKGIGAELTISMKFPTGVLTVSANREAVQYDEDTVAAIQANHQVIKDYITERAVEDLKFDNYLEGCVKLNVLLEKDNYRLQDPVMRMYNYALKQHDWDSNRSIGIIGKEREKFMETLTFNGKKLQSKLNLKHHTIAYINKPAYQGDKTNYDGLASIKITQKIIDLPKYYLDTKKNLRRNITIWEESGVNSFLLIMPKGANTVEQIAEMEMMAWTLDLDIKMYKDVPMAKVEKSGEYSTYTKRPTVTLKCRAYTGRDYYRDESYISQQFEINRDTFKMTKANGQPARIRDYVFITVDSLRDIYFDSTKKQQMKALIEYGGKKVLIINEKSYDRYISKMGMMGVLDTFQKMRKRLESEWKIQQQREVIISTVKDVLPEVIVEEFTHLLPESAQQALATPEAKETKVDVDLGQLIQRAPYNVEGLKDRIKLRILKRYPMLKAYCNAELRWRGRGDVWNEKKLQIVKDYIGMVVL